MPGIKREPIQTVLLDLDATLADSQPIYLQAYNEVFREFLGRDLDLEERVRYMGVPTLEFMSQYTSGTKLQQMAEALQNHVLRLMVNVQPFHDMKEILKVLSQVGIRMGVVTSQTSTECAVTRKYLGVDPYIQAWITVGDAAHPKPSPEPIWVCLDRMHSDPTYALMVGDSIYDMQAGKAAGVRVGAALWGTVQAKLLLDLTPDFVFHIPRDLLVLTELVPEKQ